MNRFRANPRLLAPLIAGMGMLGPFAIDTMFPAFPALAQEFQRSPLAIQQTVSLYLGAFALMSLLHGAISDSLGRRGVIIVFLSLFVFTSIGCALAPTLHVLLLCRCLQGFSGGAGVIIGRAIIRDRFEGPAAARLMSQVTLIFGIAPAIAPVFGGWMLDWLGWRAIFWSLAVFTFVLVMLCLLAMPETHPRAARIPFSARSLGAAYRTILADRPSLLLAFAGAFNFGAVFLYISSAPVIILDWLHLDERSFAWLFLPTIGGIMLGAFLAGRLAGVFGMQRIVALGFVMVATGTLASLVVNGFMAPRLPWSVLPSGLIAIGSALCSPTLTLLMLDRFPLLRGTVASLQASISIGFNALVSGLISPLFSAQPLHLALAGATISLGGFVMWTLYRLRPEVAATAPTG